MKCCLWTLHWWYLYVILWQEHSNYYTPSQRGNYHHIACSITPLPPWTYFTSKNSIMTFCKAEAAVTHNLIGRKIIFNVKHSDARNSLPILDVIRSSHKRHAPQCVIEHCRWTVRQTTGVCYTRMYMLERHLTFRRNIDTRRQWSVRNIGWNEWLYWEIVINDHCHGSVSNYLKSHPCNLKHHVMFLVWNSVLLSSSCVGVLDIFFEINLFFCWQVIFKQRSFM